MDFPPQGLLPALRSTACRPFSMPRCGSTLPTPPVFAQAQNTGIYWISSRLPIFFRQCLTSSAYRRAAPPDPASDHQSPIRLSVCGKPPRAFPRAHNARKSSNFHPPLHFLAFGEPRLPESSTGKEDRSACLQAGNAFIMTGGLIKCGPRATREPAPGPCSGKAAQGATAIVNQTKLLGVQAITEETLL